MTTVSPSAAVTTAPVAAKANPATAANIIILFIISVLPFFRRGGVNMRMVEKTYLKITIVPRGVVLSQRPFAPSSS